VRHHPLGKTFVQAREVPQAQQVLKVFKEFQALQDRTVQQVQQVLPERKVNPAQPVPQGSARPDQLALKAQQVQMALTELLAQPDLKVLRAQEEMDRLAQRVQPEHKDYQVVLVLRVQQVLKVLPDHLEQMAPPDRPARKV
jgi:hypothetical protein